MSFTQRRRLAEKARADRAAAPGVLIPGALASLETTLPPTPIKQLLAADGAGISMLTADGALVEAAYEAAGAHYPVELATSWRQLIAQVTARDAGIVLIDADFVGDRLAARLAKLRDARASVVVLVAARRESAQRLMALLLDRSIHRLLIKPAAVGVLRLLFESAVSRYLALHEPGATQAARPPERGPRRSDRTLAIGVGLLAVGATIAGALHFGAGDEPAAEAPVGAPAAVAAETAAQRLVSEPLAAQPRTGALAALETERLQSELLAVPVSIADLEFQGTGSVEYPPAAQQRGIEGSVRIEFIVETDGRPTGARVVEADPPGWFEAAALAAIGDYRFRPYAQDGVAYRRLVRARIGFELE